ncbi:unnamed protein product, partial [Larinioides sclopetarius]
MSKKNIKILQRNKNGNRLKRCSCPPSSCLHSITNKGRNMDY